MALSPQDRQAIESYLAAAREGELSAEQTRQLAARVKESDEFAWLYIQLSHLEAALRWDYSAGPDRLPDSGALHDAGLPTTERAGPKAIPVVIDSDSLEAQADPLRAWGNSLGGLFARPQMVWLAAATLAMVAMVVAIANWPGSGRTVVAHLTKAIDCQWEQQHPPAVESAFYAGDVVSLRRGSAEITFVSGARVRIESPASFRLAGANAGEMSRGVVYAIVPPSARGFTVVTPPMKIVDLGTEFGVLCRENGGAEVHVFSGRVEIVPSNVADGSPAIKAQQISAGKSLVADGGQVMVKSADRSRFVSPQQSARGARLVGFYPLNGNAHDASGRGRSATRVANVQFVPGFNGQAARFNGTAKSYIDLPINAGAKSLPRMTWGAWVKPLSLGPANPGSLGERNHEILSTDNSTRNPQYGRVLTLDLREGIGRFSGEKHRFAAFAGVERGVWPDPLREVELNRWTFAAVTYDEPRRTLSLYVELPEADERGRRLSKTEFHDTNFGDSVNFIRVAGHALGRAHPASRLGPLDGAESFHGDIDNVFVIDGCLTAEQLERIVAGGERAILGLAKEKN